MNEENKVVRTAEEIQAFKTSALYLFLVNNWGGSLWNKDGARRVYFGQKALERMFQIERNYTMLGVLESIKVCGEMLPVKEAYTYLLMLERVKVYYDIEFDAFCCDKRDAPIDFFEDIQELVGSLTEYRNKYFDKEGNANGKKEKGSCCS